jgi:hypothetical protein
MTKRPRATRNEFYCLPYLPHQPHQHHPNPAYELKTPKKKNTGRLWLAISHTAMLSAKKMPPTKVVYVTQTPVFPSALQTALMQA